MTLLEAQQLLDNAECVATADAVQAVVGRLASDISHTLAGEFPLVLAVMGGAVVFAGQLLPRLNFPLEFDYLHVTRYRGSTQGGEMEWRVLPGQNVVGRNVLVLDDILDEGETLAAIRDKLLHMGATRVWSAVLTDKDNGLAKPVLGLHRGAIDAGLQHDRTCDLACVIRLECLLADQRCRLPGIGIGGTGLRQACGR